MEFIEDGCTNPYVKALQKGVQPLSHPEKPLCEFSESILWTVLDTHASLVTLEKSVH